MNKVELIESVAEAANISKTIAKGVLDAFVTTVTASLAKGEPVALIGFGTFLVGKRAKRVGRNPKTGASLVIPEMNVPRFKAGKTLKEKVNA